MGEMRLVAPFYEECALRCADFQTFCGLLR
jgi:hypothetical protein